MNNHLHHLIDLKVTLLAGIFAFVSFSNAEIGIKILGSIVFLGYTARRWWLMEKNKDKE